MYHGFPLLLQEDVGKVPFSRSHNSFLSNLSFMITALFHNVRNWEHRQTNKITDSPGEISGSSGVAYEDDNRVEKDQRKMSLMMEAVRTSETSVYFDKTILRYIPEGCDLQKKDQNSDPSTAPRRKHAYPKCLFTWPGLLFTSRVGRT
jgi:hypothetical protein